jgi:hypothetical protein
MAHGKAVINHPTTDCGDKEQGEKAQDPFHDATPRLEESFSPFLS